MEFVRTQILLKLVEDCYHFISIKTLEEVPLQNFNKNRIIMLPLHNLEITCYVKRNSTQLSLENVYQKIFKNHIETIVIL